MTINGRASLINLSCAELPEAWRSPLDTVPGLNYASRHFRYATRPIRFSVALRYNGKGPPGCVEISQNPCGEFALLSCLCSEELEGVVGKELCIARVVSIFNWLDRRFLTEKKWALSIGSGWFTWENYSGYDEYLLRYLSVSAFWIIRRYLWLFHHQWSS